MERDWYVPYNKIFIIDTTSYAEGNIYPINFSMENESLSSQLTKEGSLEFKNYFLKNKTAA